MRKWALVMFLVFYFGVLHKEYAASFFARDYVEPGPLSRLEVFRVGPFDIEKLCNESRLRRTDQELELVSGFYNEDRQVNVRKTYIERQSVGCWEEPTPK